MPGLSELDCLRTFTRLGADCSPRRREQFFFSAVVASGYSGKGQVELAFHSHPLSSNTFDVGAGGVDC